MSDQREVLVADGALCVLTARTGIPIYDFDFRAFFPCRPPSERSPVKAVVARIGAINEYDSTYVTLLDEGIRLLHTPAEHLRASQLPGWYVSIEKFTPRSKWYAELPTSSQIQQDFEWPVFVKGIRQTSRHQKSLSVIQGAEQFESALVAYREDPILRWQPMVVREFIPLRPVDDADPNRISASFEFRTFWWKGKCVGAGRYWWEGRRYDWNEDERRQALNVAEQAAESVNVPFLVIDMAMTKSGRWIVIECNDGQESGYAGVSPLGLWAKIIDFERIKQDELA